MKGWGHVKSVPNIQLFLINMENSWVNNVKSVSHKFDKTTTGSGDHKGQIICMDSRVIGESRRKITGC